MSVQRVSESCVVQVSDAKNEKFGLTSHEVGNLSKRGLMIEGHILSKHGEQNKLRDVVVSNLHIYVTFRSRLDVVVSNLHI